MRTLIVALLVTTATPVVCDQLWDTCFKLTTKQVGHISQSSCGHFQRSSRSGARAPVSSNNENDNNDDEGHIKCVIGLNGKRYCY
jgi:hypothetical protein